MDCLELGAVGRACQKEKLRSSDRLPIISENHRMLRKLRLKKLNNCRWFSKITKKLIMKRYQSARGQ